MGPAASSARSEAWDPLVTALVPTYNGAAFIQRTLDSLADQTWRNLEILIADDHSTDDTLAVIRRFAAGRDDVRIVERESNLGWLRNANELMAEANGELMFFAFHDDTVAPTYVEKLVAALRDRPQAVLSYCDVDLTDLDGRRTTCVFDSLADEPSSLRRGLVMARLPRHWWVPNRGLFRASAYRRVGGVHPNEYGEYWADWTWLLHLALIGEFVRVPEMLCEKFFQPGSISKAERSRPTPARTAALRRAGETEVRGSSIPALHKAALMSQLKVRRAGAAVRRIQRRITKRARPLVS